MHDDTTASIRFEASQSSEAINCPSCDQAAARRVGAIPDAFEFAGRELGEGLPGGALYECRKCFLSFRHPRLPKLKLDQLYRAGIPNNWDSGRSADRPDWSRIRKYVLARGCRGPVLDVGCFDGQFLEGLENVSRRDGLEIHPIAADRARARGINIVGSDFADLSGLADDYEVAVATDVIEHVEDPAKFLLMLATRVRPGGLVIISTGNPQALSWRLMGGLYWYCVIAEHISFVGPRWCAAIGPSMGLRLVHAERFGHERVSRWKATAVCAANLAYRVSPGAVNVLRQTYRRLSGQPPKRSYAAPPPWCSAVDHYVAVFERVG